MIFYKCKKYTAGSRPRILCRSWEAGWRIGGPASSRRSCRRPCKALESKRIFSLKILENNHHTVHCWNFWKANSQIVGTTFLCSAIYFGPEYPFRNVHGLIQSYKVYASWDWVYVRWEKRWVKSLLMIAWYRNFIFACAN